MHLQHFWDTHMHAVNPDFSHNDIGHLANLIILHGMFVIQLLYRYVRAMIMSHDYYYMFTKYSYIVKSQQILQ